ncbi:uncharacterized protein F4812DRAFT_143465 [Daldinia caldariorum]|uniref:uncharacterized protein n=1 Tax=Daldinia caldariorum TaxID=326644 RepID=UPI002007B1FC|nr:uncharacterized protein F4812DRAFT_143465 [Daldinia caldariorum]KAI1464876.1 hypothetical protein F4812DRAFT_143465 [Daldinia caldariorum]
MSEANISFLYDFESKEFCLQFQRRTYAKAYQALNTEARILAETPYDVWLPCAQGLVCVRSCSRGMAVVFESQSAAEEWQKQTILGSLVKFGKEIGVCFERDWNLVDLKNKIGIWDDSLPKPKPAHIKVVKGPPAVHRRRIRVETQNYSGPHPG